MNHSEYLAKVLAKRISETIGVMMAQRISKKIIWREPGDGYIGATHVDYLIFGQSRDLKRLGGLIERGSSEKFEWTHWIAPIGSRVYELTGMLRSKSIVYYYLLCLSDGREFFLKQGRRSIKLIERLPGSTLQKLFLDILREVRDELGEKKINKTIGRLLKK